MVPRGQPKRLSFETIPETKISDNGGNVIVYVLISFHGRDVFCASSQSCSVLFFLAFVFFFARLAVNF